MAYAIFRLDETKEMALLVQDELISRQSITIRDSKSLGVKGDHTYMKLEGNNDAITKAEEIIKENKMGKKLPVREAATINNKLEKEDEDAHQGMGLIFGD
jgi:hypothetical protein